MLGSPVVRYFLAKTDPESYSVEQFERDGATVWDGVRNPQALRAINEMRPSDRVLIYHSMSASSGGPAIVALAKVTSSPRPDPENERLTVVDLSFLKRLTSPVTLKQIKESGLFSDWALVRQSRLSTMDVPNSVVEWLRDRLPGDGI